MKKIVFVLFIISLVIINNNKKEYIIPSNAIRFRIIANSNSVKDQSKKMLLKGKLQEYLSIILSKSESSWMTKNIINNNMDNIKNIINEETKDYNINYGLNYFPKKEYKGVVYPQGEYESLVIKLGNGLGDNWWCVLYPPLCFIDETSSNYGFYLQEIFQKSKN